MTDRRIVLLLAAAAVPVSACASTSSTTVQTPPSCGTATGKKVALRLTDKEPWPSVTVVPGQRITILASYGGKALSLPSLSGTTGSLCLVSRATTAGDTIRSVYVAEQAGRVQFSSSFATPTDAMDPLLGGFVVVKASA